MAESVETGTASENYSVRGFLQLSRIPFLSPGLAAVITGILLAVSDGADPQAPLVAMSIVGVAFIMLTTYYFNEYYDYEGDRINRAFTKFSGGGRALIDARVPRRLARIAGWSSVAVLAVIAVAYLLFYFSDYPLLLPLGLFGAFCGMFYTHPPFQLSYQGIGEIVIGGCYGVLALFSGYYLTSGTVSLGMLLIGIPASLTVFGLITVNELPDIEADRTVNKRTLVVRFGLKRGAAMYVAAMVLAYPFMIASILVGVNGSIAIYGLPVLLLSIVIAVVAVRGGYAEHRGQEMMGGLTILANMLSSLMFIAAAYLAVL
jgi:1,4-dihydroxy-2-naphthoate octaprenyltransferase